jgi:hypothetical protein
MMQGSRASNPNPLTYFLVWLWRHNGGQDLVEYAMLIGFLVVAAGALIPYSIASPIAHIYSVVTCYLRGTGRGS